MQKIVLSLGGSLFAGDVFNVEYLKKIKKIIFDSTRRNYFYIVVGGGKLCRNYQSYSRKIGKVSNFDLDLLGIQATRLNAEIVRSMFGKCSSEEIFLDPNKTSKFSPTKKIQVGGGWRPGNSTDYVATYLAVKNGVKMVINLTNVDYIYDKDPNKFTDAKKLEKIGWRVLREIFGNKWIPGLHLPFDPIACQLAEKNHLTVAILNGNNLANLNAFLQGKKFKGTVIS